MIDVDRFEPVLDGVMVRSLDPGYWRVVKIAEAWEEAFPVGTVVAIAGEKAMFYGYADEEAQDVYALVDVYDVMAVIHDTGASDG